MTHETNDPISPDENASAEEQTVYREKITTYTMKWIDRYQELDSLTNDHIWGDFLEDFSETTIRNLDGKYLSLLRNCLTKNGVFVDSGRGIHRDKALIKCLNAETCPYAKGTESSRVQEEQSGMDDSPTGDKSGTTKHSDRSKNGGKENGTEHEEGSEFQNKEIEHKNGEEKSEKPRNEDFQNGSSSSKSSIMKGLENLSKAMQGRPKFSGKYDEDLLEVLEVYEITCSTYDVTEEQMFKGISIILCGDAISYFGAHLRHCTSYSEVVEGLKAWFTSEEQRARLLREWQNTRLSSWLQKHSDKSQTAVFRDLCARLSRIQRQLHMDYRPDRFLKDQIVLSADLPSVSRALKEKPPITSHEATQRIAALLSDETISASCNASIDNEDQLHYSLGKRLGGEAERPYRISRKRKDKSETRSDRMMLSKVKGCWVCGKEHPARKYHPREEVEAAVNRLKNAKAFVSIDQAISVFTSEQSDVSIDESESEQSDGENLGMIAEEVENVNKEIEERLSNRCFAHSCGFFARRQAEMKIMEKCLKQQDEGQEFKGIMIDTGGNYMSMMSLEQYQAYCRMFGVPAALFKYEERSVKGIGGKQKCFGSVNIPITFHNIGVVIDVSFHITQGSTPSILCLRDLKKTGFQLDIQEDCLTFMGRREKLEVRNGLLWHQWNPDVANFSEGELKRLHRSFGHPSVSALYKILQRARPDEVDSTTKAEIEKLTQECDPCARHATKPRRFKLTTGAEDGRFNHVVAVDIMYIQSKPVLHIVDETTHFASGTWLRRVSSADLWKAFTRAWSHMYMGPPDYLRVDQGSQFVSKEFKSSVEFAGIKLLEAPIESPGTMSHVERYHGPLRAAYEKLQTSLPSENSTDLLQMAVFAVNSTIGPEGLCPCLCVFGAIPSPLRHVPAPTQMARAEAIDEAVSAVQKHHARAKVQFALKYRGPFGKEHGDLDSMQFGAKVLVYRETTSKWEGPFKFIFKDGETVVVELKHGRRIFRSTVVKPYVSSNADEEDHDNLVYALESIEQFDPDYAKSRKKELDGLVKLGVFSIVDRSSVPSGTRIFGSRFVDQLKYDGDGNSYEKSRLVARNFRDKKAKRLPTKSPTISRMGQRVSMAVMGMDRKKKRFLRDIKQAFTQSKYNLERNVFLEAVPELNVPLGKVIRVDKPLYGIPEAGLLWYLTYRDHHITSLGMRPCTVDECIMFKHEEGEDIPNISILQVDDTFGCGTEAFLREEESASQKFITKPRELLKTGKPVSFNGSHITQHEDHISVSQAARISKLRIPSSLTEADSQRASVQYISTISRPDVSSCAQMLSADIHTRSPDVVKSVCELVQYCQDTQDLTLKFPELNHDTLRIVLFTDAAFANVDGEQSQMGFVIVLADDLDNACIVHYGSLKCKRVVRSVMAAELLALVHGFDHAYVVQFTLKELLGSTVQIDAYVDSRTTFNCVGKNANTLEKRLLIDAAALRQSVRRGEIRKIGWIPGLSNPADALTRKKLPKHDHPLRILLESGKLRIAPSGWLYDSTNEK